MEDSVASLGCDVAVVPLDLEQIDSLPAKVKEAQAPFGPIDIFISNAGISQRSYLHETRYSVIERILTINFCGGAALTIELLPGMYERGSGHIVVISSIMGKFGTPLRTGYCASKHAVQGFYESLAAEAAPHGVFVTVLVPGWIRTDISKYALEGDGSPHGVVDPGQAGAKGPDAYMPGMLRAIERRRYEAYFALNWKTRLARFLNRFFPSALRAFIRRLNVT